MISLTECRGRGEGRGSLRGGVRGRRCSRLVLVVDHRQPDRVFVDGLPVSLQHLQFRLADLLAQHPGRCVPYAVVYGELWGARVVENNQIHFQLRKLRRAVAEATGRGDALIRTIPKRGILLELSREEVLLVPSGFGD